MSDRVKRLVVLFVAALFVLTIALAGPQANTKKGKVYFRTNCRVCHDGKSGAPALTPMSKTIAQWQKAFTKGGGAWKMVPRVKDKTGTALSDQDMADMGGYLVQHAADSDQPATCGS